MAFYHGRSKSRPYFGNRIYITDSLSYASLYSDSDFVYEVEILFDMSDVFSIKNDTHFNKLKGIVPHLDKINRDEELDWSMTDLLSNDNFESGLDLIESLGFKGMFLKERTGIVSILVFDQSNCALSSKIKV